jgi:hypothetical protein
VALPSRPGSRQPRVHRACQVTGGTIQAVGVTVEKAAYADLEKEAQRAMMKD